MSRGMNKTVRITAGMLALVATLPALAQRQSAQDQRKQQMAEIPICSKPLGTISVIEPEDGVNWWSGQQLPAPSKLIKVFVNKSRCFTLVDRGVGMGAAMAELGFARDPRPFHPHVTLARSREPANLREVTLSLSEQVFGESWCDSLSLFESEVTSKGSVYRTVARGGLGTPKSAPERQTEPVQTGLLDASHGSDDGWDRTM